MLLHLPYSFYPNSKATNRERIDFSAKNKTVFIVISGMVYVPLLSKKSILRRRYELWNSSMLYLIAISLAIRTLCREVPRVQQSFIDPCHPSFDGDGEADASDDAFLFILYRELSGLDYIILNPEIEKELGEKIKRGGDKKAIEKLVNHCLRYLVWLAGRVIRNYGDKEYFNLIRDLIDVGYIAAQCVAKSWDYEKGYFLPYAKKYIEGAMQTYLNDTKNIVKIPRPKKKAPGDNGDKTPSGYQQFNYCSYEDMCNSLDLDNDEIEDAGLTPQFIECTYKETELLNVAGNLVKFIETNDGCEVTHVTLLKIEERFKYHVNRLNSQWHRMIFSKLMENNGIPTYMLTDLLGSRDGKSKNKSANYARKLLEWFREALTEKDADKAASLSDEELLRSFTNAVNYIWRAHLKKKLENDEEIMKISVRIKKVIGL